MIVTTFSSIHTSKSQAYIAIWLMLTRENQSHTHTPMYFSRRSYTFVTGKMGQNYFSATSPGQAGRMVKLWDSFQAERTDPSFMLRSILAYIEPWRAHCRQQFWREFRGQANRTTKIHHIHPSFQFLKVSQNHAWGNLVYAVEAILSIPYLCCAFSWKAIWK